MRQIMQVEQQKSLQLFIKNCALQDYTLIVNKLNLIQILN